MQIWICCCCRFRRRLYRKYLFLWLLLAFSLQCRAYLLPLTLPTCCCHVPCFTSGTSDGGLVQLEHCSGTLRVVLPHLLQITASLFAPHLLSSVWLLTPQLQLAHGLWVFLVRGLKGVLVAAQVVQWRGGGGGKHSPSSLPWLTAQWKDGKQAAIGKQPLFQESHRAKAPLIASSQPPLLSVANYFSPKRKIGILLSLCIIIRPEESVLCGDGLSFIEAFQAVASQGCCSCPC